METRLLLENENILRLENEAQQTATREKLLLEDLQNTKTRNETLELTISKLESEIVSIKKNQQEQEREKYKQYNFTENLIINKPRGMEIDIEQYTRPKPIIKQRIKKKIKIEEEPTECICGHIIDEDIIKCIKCSKSYHISCSNLTNLSKKDKFMCTTCTEKSRVISKGKHKKDKHKTVLTFNKIDITENE